MFYEIDCELENPRTHTGETPTSTELWQYQAMVCQGTSTPETLELIENASTGASFYISKEINFGDILIVTFLTLFLIFGILNFLIGFVIPKFISFRR